MAGTTKVLTFSEGTSVSAPSQSFLSASTIQVYVDDAAYIAAKGSAAADGDFYYNSTLDLLRYYSNGAWSNVVDEDSVQDIVNKSLVDANNTFEDDGDGSKKMKFELSSISPTTTRTLTVPDADMILSGRDNNETITGTKSFSAVTTFSNTTQSTSKDDGAVVIEGGLGVEKNVYVGGNLIVKGTTTTIESTALDVTDANISVNKGGNQASADDIAGVKVEMSDATHAQLIYDKDAASKFRIGEVGTEKEVATLGDNQTFTNKTMTSPVLNTPDINNGTIDNADINLGTASNTQKLVVSKDTSANLLALTREEGSVYYDTDKDNLVVDDGLVLKDIGGSGSGGINHLSGTSVDAESSVGDWVTYKDAAGAVPVDGVGGSPSVTFVRSTSSPLIGNASFLFTKPASNVQGEGFSCPFTIGDAHKCEGSLVQCYLQTDANYVDSSLEVFLYDVTNAVLVYPNPSKIKKSSLVERPFFEFQFPSNSSSYRLIFHVNSTTATAYTVKADFFEIKPKTTSQNSSITDWQSYTPTGGWTGAVSYSGRYRRVGDTIDLDVTVTCSGAPTGTSLSVNLPSGLTIDDTKLSYTGQNNGNILGLTSCFDIGATGPYTCSNLSLSSLTALIATYDKGDGTLGNITTSLPFTFGASDFVRLRVSGLPILGWSAGTQVSDIYTGRQSITSAYKNADQTLSTNNTAQKITLQLFEQDDFAQLDTTNNRINILKTGSYEIKSFQRFAATNIVNNTYELRVYKNGSHIRLLDYFVPLAGNTFILQGSSKIKLNVGDYIEFYIFGAGNNSISTYNIRGAGGQIESFHSVTLDTNSSQVLASERVYESWYGCTGYTIPNTYATSTNFIAPSKLVSTHGVYNPSTGVFTAPKNGNLRMHVNFYTNPYSTFSAGDYLGVILAKPTVSSYPADIYEWTYQFVSVGVNPAGGGFTLETNVIAGQQLACIIFSSRTGVVIPSEAGTSVRSNLIWEMK